jgi:hypothetical protein
METGRIDYATGDLLEWAKQLDISQISLAHVRGRGEDIYDADFISLNHNGKTKVLKSRNGRV